MVSQWLLIGGAGVFALLGLAHLILTFFSNKFDPFNSAPHAAMQQTSPRITRNTSMWKAWIGFNASHSLGVLIFAVIYIPLALTNFDLIQQSLWLSFLPVIVGVAYLVLAKVYWFEIPFVGTLIATSCFVGSFVLGLI